MTNASETPAATRPWSGSINNWIAPFSICPRCGRSLNWKESDDVFDRPFISAKCCELHFAASLDAAAASLSETPAPPTITDEQMAEVNEAIRDLHRRIATPSLPKGSAPMIDLRSLFEIDHHVPPNELHVRVDGRTVARIQNLGDDEDIRFAVGARAGGTPEGTTPDERIAEIEARLKAATPGPWGVREEENPSNALGLREFPNMEAGVIRWIVTEAIHPQLGGPLTINTQCSTPYRVHQHYQWMEATDAQLIAHAPTDLRFLLDTVRSLTERAEAAEAEITRLRSV